jgi:two-component system cell cycle response regulator DivK
MIDPSYSHALVVEDRDDSFDIVQDLLLHDVGMRSCSRCRDGASLVAHLDGPNVGLIDLVLYNIKRPLRDDFALLPTLRLHPKLVTTRIVALTANIMPDDVDRTRLAGFDGFIGIPIDQERFTAQILRILNDEWVWEPR